MEMIKIIVCDQTVYHRKDFLRKADFNTDGGLDSIVEEAVNEVQKATSIMEISCSQNVRFSQNSRFDTFIFIPPQVDKFCSISQFLISEFQ